LRTEQDISTSNLSHLPKKRLNDLDFNRYFGLKRKSSHLRIAIIAANFLILILVFLVIFNAHNSHLSAVSGSSNQLDSSTGVIDPMDQLSSADIALNVAKMTNLPEEIAIANQAQSQKAEIAMAGANQSILSKPQIVQTNVKSNLDIVTYIVQKNQTLSEIAKLFGVSVNSIMASNNLLTQNIDPGQSLVIPPMNGIVYTVQAGDTPQSLAQKFQSNAQAIISYNNADGSSLVPGEQIIIPNGKVPPPVINLTPSCGDLYGNSSVCYNGYDFGYCTWYVATQIAVPPNWGNAATWAYYAALDGWHVSSTPVVGAIAQTPYAAGGEGHVAIVRAINPNGTIWVSEMNSYGQVSPTNPTPVGGWDVVDWQEVPVSLFPNYIYR